LAVGVSPGVLDTSVLASDDVTHLPGELAVSVVSLAELHFGVLVAKTPEARARQLAKLGQLQRRFDPLPVDEAVSDSYGLLAARIVEIGHAPGRRSMDLLIAATAHAHGAPLHQERR